MNFLFSISFSLSFLTIVAQIIFLVFFYFFIFFRKRTSVFLNNYGLLIIFLISLASTLGSLFYSEIMKYDPCKLCWIQRIFMYPQVLLLGLALIKKDKNILSYTLAFSFFGMIIAGYHYLLQLGVASGVPCSVVGYSVSCSQRFVLEFGYITIPLMSFSAFALMFLLNILSKKN